MKSLAPLIVLLWAPHILADQRDAFADYLAGAQAAGLPVAYMWVAAENLTAIEFNAPEGAVASYSSLAGLFAKIQFAPAFEGEPGELRPFAEITNSEHATVYHEMWHCYLDTYERANATAFYQDFSARAETLYGNDPAARRLEIHDEAAAQVVEQLLVSFLIWANSARNRTPWDREEWRGAENLLNLWASHFEEGQYYGYYATIGGEVWTDVSLQPPDIEVIADHVLESSFTSDFAHTFSDQHLFPENELPLAICDDAQVTVGELATLDASRSYDPEAAALEYRWQQRSGEPVLGEESVSGITTESTLSFVPAQQGTIGLALVVSDGLALSPPLPVEITVAAPTDPSAPDPGDDDPGGCAQNPTAFASRILLLLLLLRIRRRAPRLR